MQSAHQHVLQEQPDHGARDERPRIGAGLGTDCANQRNQQDREQQWGHAHHDGAALEADTLAEQDDRLG